jgi:hypothetical protein
MIDVSCPYCRCEGACGREGFLSLPALDRAMDVFAAVSDLHSKHRWTTDIDPLYLSQELTYRGYFDEDDPPKLVDVGHAQDLIREIDK